MDLSKIFSWDGDFDSPTSNIDQKVRKTFKAGEIESVHISKMAQKRGLRTDCKSWKIMNGIYGRGDYNIAIGSGADYGYCELRNTLTGDTTVMLVKEIPGTNTTKKTLKFYGADYSPLGVSEDYKSTHRGSALFAALIAFRYNKDTELLNLIQSYRDVVVDDPDSPWFDDALQADNLAILLGRISNNLYYTAKDEYEIEPQVWRLRDSDIEQISAKKPKFSFGTPTIAKAEETVGDRGMFDLNPERKLTPEEEMRVPKIPDTYKWSNYQFALAQEIRDSQEFAEPTNVILLYGDSGSGKSQGVAGIAYLLNRPRVIFTADPDTDEFKLIGSTMPNTRKGENLDIDGICKQQGIPTFEDVAFDFEDSFEKLFGKKPTSADDPCDCYKEIAKRIKVAESDFTFVESPIIQALRNGWIVEIQEPTIIKRASVLVALNSMLDYTNELMLQTGEVISRHKEAVVIMTSNMDYEGCRALQQSVLSRINDIREIPTPDEDVLYERAKSNTGFKDKTILKLMAKIIVNIKDICRNEDITDGVCGTRELQSWAKKAMLFQKRRDDQYNKIERDVVMGAAFPTVINHVSQNPEDREKIITECFAREFTPDEIAAGRNYYATGLV